MALDFEVLGEDGTPIEIVSLGIYQHDELMNMAADLQLSKLLRFEDYFEEVDLPVAELPDLSDELSIVGKSTTSAEIKRFTNDLQALIGLAVNNMQPLTAIPD
jgi:hypothetical protein